MQEPWGRDKSRYGGKLNAGLIIMAPLAWYFIKSSSTCLGWQTCSGLGLSHQSLIRKIPDTLYCSPISCRHFLNLSSFFWEDSIFKLPKTDQYRDIICIFFLKWGKRTKIQDFCIIIILADLLMKIDHSLEDLEKQVKTSYLKYVHWIYKTICLNSL